MAFAFRNVHMLRAKKDLRKLDCCLVHPIIQEISPTLRRVLYTISML